MATGKEKGRDTQVLTTGLKRQRALAKGKQVQPELNRLVRGGGNAPRPLDSKLFYLTPAVGGQVQGEGGVWS